MIPDLQIRYFVAERYLAPRSTSRSVANSTPVLFPELSNEGFVEFDRFEDIRRGTKFDEVRRFLEQIDDDHDEYLDLFRC